MDYTDLIKSTCRNHPNLTTALLHYVSKTNPWNLTNFSSQLSEIFKFNRADSMEKTLENKTISGLKPDCYILIRNKKLIVDFSYHFLRDLIYKRHGEFIEAHVFYGKMSETIVGIDLLARKVDIDQKLYTALALSKEHSSNISDVCGVLVLARVDGTVKYSVYYRYSELYLASSTQTGTSLDLKIPTKKSNGTAMSTSEINAAAHKTLEMVKKTATRLYIRSYYSDLSEDIPEDEYTFDEQSAPKKTADTADTAVKAEMNTPEKTADTADTTVKAEVNTLEKTADTALKTEKIDTIENLGKMIQEAKSREALNETVDLIRKFNPTPLERQKLFSEYLEKDKEFKKVEAVQ